MKQVTRLSCAIVCVFLLAGCRFGLRSEENVYRDLIKNFDDLNSILSRVTDQATAEDARARVQKLAPKLKELKQQKDQNDKVVPDAKLTEIRNKYDPALGAAITRVANQYQRIRRNVPAAKGLIGDAQELFQSMNIVVAQ